MLNILLIVFFVVYVISGIILTLNTRSVAKRMESAMEEYFQKKPENRELLKNVKPHKILAIMYVVSFIPVYNTYLLFKSITK